MLWHKHIEGTTRRVREADTPVICWFLTRHLSYFQLPGTRTLCFCCYITTQQAQRLGLGRASLSSSSSPVPVLPLLLSFTCLCLWVASWILSRRCASSFAPRGVTKRHHCYWLAIAERNVSRTKRALNVFSSSYCLLSITIINGLLFPIPLLYS